MSDNPIRIEADAFGKSWLRCTFRDGMLYGGSLGGPVGKTVALRVVYLSEDPDRWEQDAHRLANRLRRAGYERVSVEMEQEQGE